MAEDIAGDIAAGMTEDTIVGITEVTGDGMAVIGGGEMTGLFQHL
jgi:hypothetical protein